MVAMLYRSVTQAVLLFGSATWVLSAAMERTVEGTHIGFLRKITGKRAWREEERTRSKPAAEEVREAAVTQLDKT